MELKGKVAMAAATLAAALGAGHVMQNGLGITAEISTMEAVAPQAIMPLAAGLGAVPELPKAAAPAPALPDTAFSPPTYVPGKAARQQPERQSSESFLPEALRPAAPDTTVPDVADTKITEPEAVAPESLLPEMALSGDSTNCPISLDVIASEKATLDLTLIAPCRASERVVIRHGGLTITAMTSLTGTVFTSLPGMEASGEVSAFFNDGAEATAAEALPDLALYRRFAVQWVADDTFQLNAFEGGASYGTTGHVSAASPARRLGNVPTKGGYLSVLGDATAPLPMLAEVYTFPVDTAEAVDLTVEVTVTEATCDRELLGDVLLSEAGQVTMTDLMMATPTCDAIGDVLVLNNPLPDMKLAVSN